MTLGVAVVALALVAGAIGWAIGRREGAPAPATRPAVPPVPALVADDADELWARGRDGWTRLARDPSGAWVPATRDRVVSGELPVFPPHQAWALDRTTDAAVREALEGWSEAAVSASRVAWVLEIPAGDRLLDAWCRRSDPVDDPATAFARWFVAEVGRASRRGLVDRATAERRDIVGRSVLRACARLVEALDPDLQVAFEAPLAVGPRDRDRWLVDEVVARRLDNPLQAGLLRPMVVLRPLLQQGDRVLLEGEVG